MKVPAPRAARPYTPLDKAQLCLDDVVHQVMRNVVVVAWRGVERALWLTLNRDRNRVASHPRAFERYMHTPTLEASWRTGK